MYRKDFQQTILAAASRGAIVLTANKRLSRNLRQLFDEAKREAGAAVWPTPRIWSADSWLAQALVPIGEDWRALSGDQVQRLWEEAVEADAENSGLGLLQVPASARKAREAHELLVEYRVDLRGWALTDDHQAFLRWREHFLGRCTEGKWLEPARVAGRVATALESGEMPAPAEILLAGFDDVPPRLRRLAETISRLGCSVKELSPPTSPLEEQLRVPCDDTLDEVRQAACWARQKVEAGGGRIGIVVPELRAYRPLIERIFREELDPHSLVSLAGEESRFSLSLGGPLSGQGLVAAALSLLEASKRVSLAEAGFLLRNPYLDGSWSEAPSRASLDAHLRSLGGGDWKLAELAVLSDGGSGGRGRARPSPIMAGIFRTLLSAADERGPFLPGKWIHLFSDLLGQVGWPGDRPLDSLEFQARKAWREKLLPTMAALDAVSRPLSRKEALALLQRLAAGIEFQPETPEGPIHVVGQLEAAGLLFDDLWVMGLHEEALPAPARPNPFLPAALQVAAGMPRADARREADFSARVLRRLAGAAPRVIFSHPMQDGDCPLRPSPLLRNMPAAQVSGAASRAPARLIREGAGEMEIFRDVYGPSLESAEETSGGTAVLKDQALCPFRAFARHRLKAAPLADPGAGIDPATRGTLLHAVLEVFWREIRKWEVLAALDESTLERQVAEAVETVLAGANGPAGRTVRGPLLEIERERLFLLVREWLTEVELRREPFTVVELEGERRACFGGIDFRTRVDRVDELAGGRRVVLDYKTGKFDLNDLLTEPPLEPQLPVYGVGEGDDRLAGVAVAVLRRGECRLKGVAREGDLLPRTEAFDGSKPAEKHGLDGWDSLLERWRAGLESLGREFAAGAAAVAPVGFQKACRYCDLGAFCRIGEAGRLPGPEKGDEE